MKTWLLRIIWLLLLGCLASGLRAQPLDIGAATPLPDMAGALSASPRHTPLANAQQALALYRRGGFDKLPGSLGAATAQPKSGWRLTCRPAPARPSC